jgi:hypothetical protein
LNTSIAVNSSYDLWKARKNELNDKLAEVENQRQQGFEHIVRTFVGDLDISALAAEDSAGLDISEKLKYFSLDIAAFRFLARCQKLNRSDTSLLDNEWDEVLAIVVQVYKKRQYERWRMEEKEVELILSPQFFHLSDEQGFMLASEKEISPWRQSARAYLIWQKTLNGRTQQFKDFQKAYQTALDETEAQTLPTLRNELLKFTGEQNNPPQTPDDSAERLSRELLINFRFNTAQKISRIDQAIETLQGLLFSVRADRFKSNTLESRWTIPFESEAGFDQEWQWMGTYRTWRAAIMVFAYPENHLNPSFFVLEEPFLKPTEAFRTLMK